MEQKDQRWYVEHVRNISRFFVENRQISWVLLILAVAFGISGYESMPRRKDPDIPVKSALIAYPWKGESPEIIEQLATRKIEEAVSGNKAVEKIKSTVRVGTTFVQVDFKEETPAADVDKELDDLKIRLDGIRDFPPESGPLIYIKDFGDTAALMLTLASPKNGDVRNELLARDIREAILKARAKHPSARRATFLGTFPLSIEPRIARDFSNLWARRATAQGFARDPELISGPGFTGVDFSTGLDDAKLAGQVDLVIRNLIVPSDIPPDVALPVVVSDLRQLPARIAGLDSDKYSYREIQDFSDLIRRRLQGVPFVSKVERSGILDEEIDLTYSQARLASFKLNGTQIQQTIQARNIPNIGGTMESAGRLVNVEPTGEYKDINDIRGTVVGKSPSGAPLYLRDILDVSRVYKNPPDFLNFLNWRDDQGRWHRSRAITFSVQMRPGLQIQKFATAVEKELEAVKKLVPSDLILEKTSDQPRQVEENIDLFNESLYEAIAIVIAISMIGFWEWRAAALLALSIPITLALAYGVMNAVRLDLQQVSIAAMIIALGLLVDNPVVASDAIKNAMAEGYDRLNASWVGPTRLRRAVFFATITNIAAYLPFLLMTGSTGEFLYSLPVAMTSALGSSLLVAWAFIPFLAYYVLRPSGKPKKRDKNGGFIGYYRKIAKFAIEHRKRVLLGMSVVLACGVVIGGTLKQSFFPNDLSQFSYADVWLPQNAALWATNEKAVEVEALIRRETPRFEKEILGNKWVKEHPSGILKSVMSFVGGGGPRFWYSFSPQPRQKNYALVLIEITDKWQTPKLIDYLQRKVDSEVAGARVDMRELQTGPTFDAPVSIRLSGENIVTLRKYADRLQKILESTPRARRVYQDWGNDRLYLKLDIDSDRAALAGLTNRDIADASSVAMDGLMLTALREGDKQIPIVAKLRADERVDPSSLGNLYVYPSRGNRPVQLGEVAAPRTLMGPEMIFRYNQFRTIQVRAFPASGALASEILKDSSGAIQELERELPPGYKIEFGGEIEEQTRGNKPLPKILLISVVGIFLALMFQFRSAIKPFIVFSAIPFGVCGAIVGLRVMGAPFGFMAFLGIISLIGVIVSHIIVLFDFIEEAHERGEGLEDALLDAGTERLRPVLITVAATVFALVPLAIHGGPLWQPLCYAQIGGLTAATVVTLVLVPVIYTVFVEDLKWVAWQGRRRS
jgi:multidrug efflux pump subunit AcrB